MIYIIEWISLFMERQKCVYTFIFQWIWTRCQASNRWYPHRRSLIRNWSTHTWSSRLLGSRWVHLRHVNFNPFSVVKVNNETTNRQSSVERRIGHESTGKTLICTDHGLTTCCMPNEQMVSKEIWVIIRGLRSTFKLLSFNCSYCHLRRWKAHNIQWPLGSHSIFPYLVICS